MAGRLLHRAAGSLEALAPIGLEQLTAEASLQTRVDRKYLVPLAAVDRLLAGLGDARALEIDGLRRFGYESTYFDTAGLESYRSAAQRRRRRYKVRTRAYLDSGACALEVKTRGGRSTTVKERLDYDFERRDRLTLAGLDHLEQVLEEAGIPEPAGPLLPTLRTRYDRATLLLPEEGSRVTIDTALAWQDLQGAGLRLPGHAVIETKSASTAGRADRLLWRAGIRPVGISKYGTGLAALRSGLPANKWHRILVEHFAGAERPAPLTRAAAVEGMETRRATAQDGAGA